MLQDLAGAFKTYKTIFFLAIIEIRAKYQRSRLGVIWDLIIVLIVSIAISFIWGKILKQEFLNFFPFIFSGFSFLTVINASIGEASTMFIKKYQGLLLNLSINKFILILRLVFTSILVYLHFIVLISLPISFMIFELSAINILQLFLGLLIFFLNLIFIVTIISFMVARFRDLEPLIKILLSFIPLLTPIFWKKDMLGNYEQYIFLNPFAILLEILREPLQGKLVNIDLYFYSLILTIFLILISKVIYSTSKNKLVYWI